MTNNNENKTILLVEDEAIISLATSSVIKSFGYKVITVASGKRAVEHAVSNDSINLILMDIDLGNGIDGTESARQILAIRNIPIVFLTSHSERDMVDRVRGITRYGYVIKSSGDFVLQSSIEMAFELFEANSNTERSIKAVMESEENLRIHQAELEMQNDELLRNQRNLDLLREKYFKLYDLAPVSYFTLSEEGIILEANLSAAALFGIARKVLTGQLFAKFISSDDQDIYYLHCRELMMKYLEHQESKVTLLSGGIEHSCGSQTGEEESCELKMKCHDGTVFSALLKGGISEDAEGVPVFRLVAVKVN